MMGTMTNLKSSTLQQGTVSSNTRSKCCCYWYLVTQSMERSMVFARVEDLTEPAASVVSQVRSLFYVLAYMHVVAIPCNTLHC